MRIALIAPASLDTRSGGYLYDRMMVSHLIEAGDDVHVIPLEEYGDDPRPIEDLLMTNKPDIILEDGLCFDLISYLNGRLARSLPSKRVALMHNPSSMLLPKGPARTIAARREREFLLNVDATICNSRTTLRDIDRTTGVTRPSIVANPGKDHIGPVREREERHRGIHMISVGNVVPNKGYDRLLEALALLEDEEWTLSIAGDPCADRAYFEHLVGRIEDLDLVRRIRFLGHLEAEDLSKEYERADVFASASTYEGWGIANVEAMGCGLGIVTSSSGASPEYILDDVHGFLADPYSTEVIADRVAALLGDASLRRRLGEMARRRHEELPTWRESMERIRTFLLRFCFDDGI